MKIINTILAVAFALTRTMASAQTTEIESADMFQALEDAGANLEVAMGQVYVGVKDLWCSRENSYSEYTCEMIDQSVEGEGKKIVVRGQKAEAILAAFPGEAPFDPYAVFEFSVSLVTCKSKNGPIDLEVGELYTCEVQAE